MQVNSTLTILHDGQFWVGICELQEGGRYGAQRIVFGPHEPTDEVVLAFVCEQWAALDFIMIATEGNAAAGGVREAGIGAGIGASTGKINPKRQQRLIHRAVEQRGVGTKAQQAMREGYEQVKEERADNARDRRRFETARKFDLKQQKRKEKRRGH